MKTLPKSSSRSSGLIGFLHRLDEKAGPAPLALGIAIGGAVASIGSLVFVGSLNYWALAYFAVGGSVVALARLRKGKVGS